MAAKVIYELAVATGTYQAQDGQKTRYKNVGKIFQNDDGSKFITMEATFNPAGVPRKDGSDSIFVSMFPPKDANGNAPAKAPPPKPKPAPSQDEAF